jgi:sec-independent protein translocase protein TatA
MGNIGPGELLIIALIALLIFGAGRIADIGKGLGQGIKNFKQGLNEGEPEPEPKKTAKSEPKSTKKKRVVIEEEEDDDGDEDDAPKAKEKEA